MKNEAKSAGGEEPHTFRKKITLSKLVKKLIVLQDWVTDLIKSPKNKQLCEFFPDASAVLW